MGTHFTKRWELGGARRDRTADLLHAMQALSQLSYSPTREARNVWKRSGTVKKRACCVSCRSRCSSVRRSAAPPARPSASGREPVGQRPASTCIEALRASRCGGDEAVGSLCHRDRRSVFSRSVRHGMPRYVDSSCTPPESVIAARAELDQRHELARSRAARSDGCQGPIAAPTTARTPRASCGCADERRTGAAVAPRSTAAAPPDRRACARWSTFDGRCSVTTA